MKCAALLLTLLILLSGCTGQGNRQAVQPPAFEEGIHKTTIEYRSYFEYFTARNSSCVVSIQKSVFDEKTSVSLWEKVVNDSLAIAAIASADVREHTVYIVDKTLNGVQQIEEKVYCTAEDIYSGNYRSALVGAALGICEPWITVGIAGYTFSEALNMKMLRDYYTQAENLDVLSLFAAYFFDGFANEQEISIARQTAVSLCGYILEKYGVKAFGEGKLDVYKQKWLLELGVDREYNDLNSGLLEGYRYASTDEYPLVVTTDRFDVLYIKPMPGDLKTPEQIRLFLCGAKEGMEAIFEAVEQEAPDCLQAVLDNYSLRISYYFYPNEKFSFAYGDRVIYLTSSHSFLHETVHIIVPPYITYYGESWRGEAIAEFLPNMYYQPFNEYSLFCKTIVENSLKNPQSGWKFEPIYEVYSRAGTSIKENGGNELSYEEAFVFAAYLADKYSLSLFLGYCLDSNARFEEVFGAKYEDVKAEWIEEIINRN